MNFKNCPTIKNDYIPIQGIVMAELKYFILILISETVILFYLYLYFLII